MTRLFWKTIRLVSAAGICLALSFAFAPFVLGDVQQREIAVRVGGLACPFCVYGLEKHLGRLPGVESVETDLAHGQVVLRIEKNGNPPTEERIREAVKRAGFTVIEIRGGTSSGIGDGVD